MNKDNAPKHLTPESNKLWRTISYIYELDGLGMVLLKVCLEAYDRLLMARKIILEDGIVLETHTGFKKVHPALRIEK